MSAISAVNVISGLALALTLRGMPPHANAAPAGSDDAILRIVSRFIAAERDFDAATMAELMTRDYFEVSPIGELDRREAVLGFYEASKKRPLPETAILEHEIKNAGRARLFTAKLAFERRIAEGPVTTAMLRATYLVVQTSDGWQIAAAQFTPIRSKP